MMLGLAILALAGGQDVAAAEAMLMPGAVDIPVTDAARIDPTCGGGRDGINPGDGLICLQPRSGDLETLQIDYAQAALEAGWRLAFIQGATVFVERPDSEGRCDNLAFSQVNAGEGAATALAVILEHGMPCVQGDAQ